MPNILHRLTIDAPPERVHELLASKEGVAQWWTARPLTGDDAVGGRLAAYFGDSDEPAAVFEILQRDGDLVAWRCVDGPDDWMQTRISFTLRARADGGTTLLFRHDDWPAESEFMNGCSTNWAAYLMSLKAGAERAAFNPWPGGEMSRWD